MRLGLFIAMITGAGGFFAGRWASTNSPDSFHYSSTHGMPVMFEAHRELTKAAPGKAQDHFYNAKTTWKVTNLDEKPAELSIPRQVHVEQTGNRLWSGKIPDGTLPEGAFVLKSGESREFTSTGKMLQSSPLDGDSVCSIAALVNGEHRLLVGPMKVAVVGGK